MKNPNGCLICGADLKYSEDYQTFSCYYCRAEFQSNVSCLNEHYVCDNCHAKSGTDLIETFCNHSASVNPFEMAIEIMRSEKISMHGPEHHFLVPAVLLAAYSNKTGTPGKPENIAIARRRSERIPGGFCGTHGNCGAGVGTGIFISIITASTPLAREEWRLSNLATGKSLVSIAEHGGPRCCKRDVYLAILEAVLFLEEHFSVKLEKSKIRCEFSGNNRECLKGDCPFFRGW